MRDVTKHAVARAQQRGVPPLVIDLVVRFGKVARRNGADVFYLDKRSRKSIRREVGGIAYRRLEDLLDTYVVLSDDGEIITTAKRIRRLKH